MKPALAISMFVLAGSIGCVNAEEQAVGNSTRCKQSGGAWEENKFEPWFGQCWFDWNKDECSTKRATWVPMVGRCRIEVTFEGVLADCKAFGGAWEENAYGRSECNVPSLRKQCVDEGGKWNIGNPNSISRCLRRTEDGGKPCTSSGQCVLRCMAVNRFADHGEPGEGVCQETELPGCGGLYIENGVVRRVTCFY